MDAIVITGGIFVVLGIIGSLIPALPGPALSFAGIALLFFEKGSGMVPVHHLVIFGVLVVLFILADYLAPILGAKLAGSSKMGTYGAIIGALIGIIFFPPMGIFVGAFIGAVAVEYHSGKSRNAAFKAGLGVVFGSIAVIVAQVAYSVVAAVYFFAKFI